MADNLTSPHDWISVFCGGMDHTQNISLTPNSKHAFMALFVYII